MMDKGCFSSSGQIWFFPMSMCWRRFDRQRPFQAGSPNLKGSNSLTRKNAHDLTCCCKGDNRDFSSFNCLSPSLFAIYKCQDSCHNPAGCSHGIYGTERRRSSGNDVFDHCYAITLPERTFKELPGSMAFCLFSHCECSQRMMGPGTGVADCVGDGIGTQCEPTNGVDTPTSFSKDGERKWSDDGETVRTHRRESRIDVEGRLLS